MRKLNLLICLFACLAAASFFLGHHYFSNSEIANNNQMPKHYCAVQASPEIRTFLQPDGTSFEGYVRGTRTMYYVETIDGYTLLKDNDLSLIHISEPTRP